MIDLDKMSCLSCGYTGLFDAIDWYECHNCGNRIMDGKQLDKLRGINGQANKKTSERHKENS